MTRLVRQIPDQAEWQVQISVMDHWRARAAPSSLVFAVPNGGYIMEPKVVAKLKAMGLTPGIPDLCVLVAGKPLLGLELKREGRGSQSGEQKAIQAAWEGCGAAYRIAHGLDEALTVLADYGAIR